MFRYSAADILTGILSWSMLKERIFRMSKQLTYIIVLLFMVTLAAAETANAKSISVELAERTPPVEDPGDPTLPPTTTTTTTTLPTIPRCPNFPPSDATAATRDGYNYWSFHDETLFSEAGVITIYCFENPEVQQTLTDYVPYEFVTQEIAPLVDDGGPIGLEIWDMDMSSLPPDYYFYYGMEGSWDAFAAGVTGRSAQHGDACFICGRFRAIGCFPPGVKITMADGSFRKIEDVRAGDLVQNAKTGTPVKVDQVIEGPEALPLIRFGFEGTTVTTSQAHPVLTAAGLKPANELKKGDTIFDAQRKPHFVTILDTLPLEEGQRVINVSLDVASSDADERLIVSDGIITGDIVLQGLLKERK